MMVSMANGTDVDDLTSLFASRTNYTAMDIVMFSVTTVCGAVTIFGNTVVILAIRRNRHLHTMTNQYIVSLACTDLAVGVLALYYSCFYLFPWLSNLKSFCFSRMIQLVPAFSSIMHLWVIAIDRFMAIVYPLRYHAMMTQRRTSIIIGFIWVYSVIMCAVLLVSSDWQVGEQCSLYHIGIPPVLVTFYTCQYVIEVIGMVILYGKIFAVARQQANKIHVIKVSPCNNTSQGTKGVDVLNGPKPRSNSEGSAAKVSFQKEMKAAKPLSIIIGFFLLCYTGMMVLISMAALGYPFKDFMSLYRVMLLLVFFNSLVNPLIYTAINKEFREAFRMVLCACKKA